MPLLRIYALTAIVLALKMGANAVVQGIARIPGKQFVHLEDARFFGGADTVGEEPAMSRRAGHAWRNDLENIPMFLILGMIYVYAAMPAMPFLIYCVVFTSARIFHTIFFLRAAQPWRTIAYFTGQLATAALIVHLALGVVLAGGD